VAGFANLYAYGVSKVTFLPILTGRTIHNLEDITRPPSDAFNHKHWFTMPCNKLPKFPCATKTAHSLYDWLMHYLQTNIMSNILPSYTSYCRFYFSSINWTCTTASPVTLRWLLDANGPLPPATLLLLGRRGWSSWSCWSLPTSVHIGTQILHSIPSGYFFVTCFSLMRPGPNTCLLVSTALGVIRRGVGPKTLILSD